MSATFQPEPVVPQKSSTGKIILIVIAIIMILGLLACGGMAALFYFGWNAASRAAGDEFKKQLAGNTVLENEVGADYTLRLDLMETARRAENSPEGPQMVFEISGSKGSGVLLAKVSQGANNRILSATLETADGRSVEIPISGEAGNTDGFTVDEGELDQSEGSAEPEPALESP